MSIITLAEIEAAHQQVSEMIAAFKAQAPHVVSIPQALVELQPGEHYAGIVLDGDGAPSHHLILLPGDADDVTWDQAKAFAADAGGELPTRREQALLFANLKGQFEPRYYWSSEQHAANDDYAWGQGFNGGTQLNNVKSASLRARAVRRLTIQ
jgi:formylglycine-generating enzyme required for sulfatase activity